MNLGQDFEARFGQDFKLRLSRDTDVWLRFEVNPIQGGGGLISPPCHVFAYTHVSMRIRVLIFCDFSSFLVWKRLQDFRLNKMSPFSQEK